MGLKGLRLSVLTVAIALLCHGLARIAIGLNQGYVWADMDWNRDGAVSPFELIAAGDIGLRRVEHAGSPCKDYFSLKDGLPLRTICTGDETGAAPDAKAGIREQSIRMTRLNLANGLRDEGIKHQVNIVIDSSMSDADNSIRTIRALQVTWPSINAQKLSPW